MNPTQLESVLPVRLNFYAKTLLEKLEFSPEPEAMQAIFEGEPLFMSSRIWIDSNQRQGLYLEFFGDPESLECLASHSAHLELTNVVGSRLIARLQGTNPTLSLSPPSQVSEHQPRGVLTPFAAYHLANPQDGQSQGLLLVSLETRAPTLESTPQAHPSQRELEGNQPL